MTSHTLTVSPGHHRAGPITEVSLAQRVPRVGDSRQTSVQRQYYCETKTTPRELTTLLSKFRAVNCVSA